MTEWKNILFKEIENRKLYLDLFVPEDVPTPPIIMWVHGGGWNELNRTWSLIMPMLERGYAVASVDYRYCDEAAFPAQMSDLKDALLFLKKHGDAYGYDAGKIAVSGDSAGAHLACLVGVSAGHKDWERPGEDYSVQAIVDISGPIRLSDSFSLDNPPKDVSNIEQLFGVKADSKAFLAAALLGCPLSYINGTEPPVLIMQGTDDPIVPVSQARLFRNALEEAGDKVHMYLVPGGHHSMGGKVFDDILCEFLDFYLKGTVTVTEPKVLAEHYRNVDLLDGVSREMKKGC